MIGPITPEVMAVSRNTSVPLAVSTSLACFKIIRNIIAYANINNNV
jgi:hypothetical protein